MNKIIEIGNGDRHLVPFFLEFTKTIFSWANFSDWHLHGYWPAEYIPHSIIRNGKIASNVSVTKMDLILNGKRGKGIQIGTVGTIPEERNKGLSRILMDHVIKKYENEADIFFLFANDTVLKFYPKFGFSRKFETLYISEKSVVPAKGKLKKLNWKNPGDLEIIEKTLKNRSPLTSIFGAENYHPISLWHVINEYPDDLYFCEELDIILIFYVKDEQIQLIDLAYTNKPDLEKLVSYIYNTSAAESICFHFPPDITDFDYDREVVGENTMLFVKGEFEPQEGFKFPVTSQT